MNIKFYLAKIAWSSNKWKGLSGYDKDEYERDVDKATYDYKNQPAFSGFFHEWWNFAEKEEFIDKINGISEKFYGYILTKTGKVDIDNGDFNIVIFQSADVSDKNKIKVVGFYVDAKKLDGLSYKVKINEKLISSRVKMHSDKINFNISGIRNKSFLLESPIQINQKDLWEKPLGQSNFKKLNFSVAISAIKKLLSLAEKEKDKKNLENLLKEYGNFDEIKEDKKKL